MVRTEAEIRAKIAELEKRKADALARGWFGTVADIEIQIKTLKTML